MHAMHEGSTVGCIRLCNYPGHHQVWTGDRPPRSPGPQWQDGYVIRRQPRASAPGLPLPDRRCPAERRREGMTKPARPSKAITHGSHRPTACSAGNSSGPRNVCLETRGGDVR